MSWTATSGLEFEYAAGNDGFHIELDSVGTAGKVFPAAGDDANRVQRLFVQRVAGMYTVVHDGKDGDAKPFGKEDPPPLREVRVVMKGSPAGRTPARLYAVRGGELEPRTTPTHLVTQAVPRTRGIQVDFTKSGGDRLDGWEVAGGSTQPTVCEKGDRRWLGLKEKGGALVTLPKVDLAGDFVAEVDFTIGREGAFGVRLLRAERGGGDKFFELMFDGPGDVAVANAVPKMKLSPGKAKLRYDKPNNLRIVRTGGAITIEHNGTTYSPVTEYPRVAFTAVQVMFGERAMPAATPVGVTRVNVTPK